MSDSVRPHKQQPTRLPCPWDSPGKNTGVGCHFLLQCMKVKSESEVAQSCLTLSDPMDCGHQAPPSKGFSRQECQSGVPLPSLSFFLFCNVFLSYLDAPLLTFQVFKLKYSWVAISQLVAQTVKNLPAVQETRVQSLGANTNLSCLFMQTMIS